MGGGCPLTHLGRMAESGWLRVSGRGRAGRRARSVWRTDRHARARARAAPPRHCREFSGGRRAETPAPPRGEANPSDGARPANFPERARARAPRDISLPRFAASILIPRWVARVGIRSPHPQQHAMLVSSDVFFMNGIVCGVVGAFARAARSIRIRSGAGKNARARRPGEPGVRPAIEVRGGGWLRNWGRRVAIQTGRRRVSTGSQSPSCAAGAS